MTEISTSSITKAKKFNIDTVENAAKTPTPNSPGPSWA